MTQIVKQHFFFNWCLYEIHDGEIDSTLMLFGGGTSFHLSGYVNSQNNRYWSAENPMLIHEGGWCVHAVSVLGLLAPLFSLGP